METIITPENFNMNSCPVCGSTKIQIQLDTNNEEWLVCEKCERLFKIDYPQEKDQTL